MTQIPSLAAIGRQLDDALHLVEAARAVPRANAGGGPAANSTMVELLGSSLVQTQAAAADMILAGVATRDAYQAVDALMTNLERVVQHDRIADARNGARLLASIDDVARVAAHLQSPEAAGTLTSKQSLLAEVHAIIAKPRSGVTMDDVRRLATIMDMPEHLRPTMPQPRTNSLSRLRDGYISATPLQNELDHLRAWVAAERLVSDPSVTRESLLRDIDSILFSADGMPRSADEINDASLLHLDAIRKLPAAGELDVFHTLPSMDHHAGVTTPGFQAPRWVDALGQDDVQIWLQNQRLFEDPLTTKQTLTADALAIVRKRDSQITRADYHRLAAIDTLDDGRRPDFPRAEDTAVKLQEAAASWANPMEVVYGRRSINQIRIWDQANRIAADPATSAAQLQDELRSILAKSDEALTKKDTWRLAVIRSLPPSHLPPALTETTSPSLWRNWASDGVKLSNQPQLQALVNEQRVAVEVERIVADPAATSTALYDEAMTMLGKPDEQLTRGDLLRLAAFQELPDRLNPRLGSGRDFKISQLLLHDVTISPNGLLNQELDYLRNTPIRRAMEADPSITSQSLTDEIARILNTPGETPSTSDFERLILIDELDGAKRPGFPTYPPMREIRRISTNPTGNWERNMSRELLEQILVWADLRTDAGIERVGQRIAAGDSLDPVVFKAIRQLDEARIQRLGLDVETLVADTLNSIMQTTSEGDAPGVHELEALQNLVGTLTAGDDASRAIKGDIQALLGRNIDRMSGRLHDGYNSEPDYAELGRAIAQVDLLLQLRTSAARSIAEAGETLTW